MESLGLRVLSGSTTSDKEHSNDLRLSRDTLNSEKDGVSRLKGRSFGIVLCLPFCAG